MIKEFVLSLRAQALLGNPSAQALANMQKRSSHLTISRFHGNESSFVAEFSNSQSGLQSLCRIDTQKPNTSPAFCKCNGIASGKSCFADSAGTQKNMQPRHFFCEHYTVLDLEK